MDYTYKKIRVEDVFVSVKEDGFRLTGNDFMNPIIRMIHAYGSVDVKYVAKRLGVSGVEIQYVMKALTGVTFYAWRDAYLLKMIDELLLDKTQTFAMIAKRLGFSSMKVLSCFYRQKAGRSMYEKRHGCSYHG